jgi:phage/plasmid primase-like uncharacterized protein
MTDLLEYFGGLPLCDDTQLGHEPEPADRQLKEAMRQAGISPPDTVVLDGQLHRFPIGNSKDRGYYKAYGDGVPAGFFGDHAGELTNWRADMGRTLTPMEEAELEARMARAKEAREAEKALRARAAAKRAESIWANSNPAPTDHPYLQRKGIGPNVARMSSDGRLVVPMLDGGNNIVSVQHIDDAGKKLFLSGSQITGSFAVIGSTDNSDHIYLAEGFATAATIHEATGRPCVVAFSAHNLGPVAALVHKKLPNLPLTIVADNDRGGQGESHATQAAAETGARWVMPPKDDPDASVDANDFVQAGGDLKALLEPQGDGWLIPVKDLVANCRPVRWLVKEWLQANGLAMLHGPSGTGKSFLAIDMACRVASGVKRWGSAKVRSGPVVYLAGEGHEGIAMRVLGWQLANDAPKDFPMWVSESGCHLDTDAGYVKARDAIRGLPDPPRLVVVDTLHRHLSGDENLATDAAKMVHYCDLLRGEFECTIMWVHHTGNNVEAKKRARGSSAWKGVLDSEINLEALEDGQIQVNCMKAKERAAPEPIMATLKPVRIPELFDEDGDPVGSAVFSVDDGMVELLGDIQGPPVDDTVAQAKKLLERAWFYGGCEGSPATILADTLAALLRADMSSWTTGEKAVDILEARNMLESFGNGWAVKCPEWAKDLESRR